MASLIKDIASFLPGIFLIVGYFIAMLASSCERTTQPPIFDYVAETKERHLGDIPKDKFYYEDDQGTKPVNLQIPVSDSNGIPVLKQVPVVAGRGRPVFLGVEMKEIVMPRLKNPSFILSRSICLGNMVFSLDGRKVRPSENPKYDSKRQLILFRHEASIDLRPTGIFERRSIIEYRSRFDQLAFSVWGTLLGTVAGMLCILYQRIRPNGKGRSSGEPQ